MKKQLLNLLSTFAWMLLTTLPSQAQYSGEFDWKTPYYAQWNPSQADRLTDSIRTTLYSGISVQTSVVSTAEKDENRDESSVIQKVSSYIPDKFEIDKNKAVGEIPIQSGVSPTGAVTYQVPIEVYSGIHGMQPQLSIAYNSLAGNGPLGVGWNISGLSSIVRGTQSYYYDGKAQNVTLTTSDAFYLDGMRLIKTSETTTQIKYESEQGNIKVSANKSGTTVKYFDVYFPNGTKGTYGYTSNAGTNYLEYPLTSLSDLFDNSITCTYTYADNHYRINKISYANASIDFAYETRADVQISYTAGLKVLENQRLQSITCKFGSSVLRKYMLGYTVQNGVSLLNAINYSAPDGSSFNPLKFYYGENNTVNSYSSSKATINGSYYNFDSPNLMKVAKGKLDYNSGDDGLIVFPYKNPYYQTTANGVKKFTNRYSGAESIYIYTGLESISSNQPITLTTGTGFVDIFCANIDGQGGDEIVRVNNSVYTLGNFEIINFTVYTLTASGLSTKYNHSFNFSTVITDDSGNKSVHPKSYYAGDFNGDGKMEVLAVSCSKPFDDPNYPTKCYLFDLEAGVKLYEGSFCNLQMVFGEWDFNNPYAYNNSDRLFVGDFNGDGKSEFCIVNSNGTSLYKFITTGPSYNSAPYASYTGLKLGDLTNRSLLLGEFNGDGKPDLLLSPPSTSTSDSNWSVFYSTGGSGAFEKTTFSSASNADGVGFFLQDVNGDGRSDLIKLQNTTLYTYLSNNNTLSSSSTASTAITANSVIIPFDLDGWNYNNQLISLKDNMVTKYSFKRNDAGDRLLTGMVTSMGLVTKNKYQMLYNASYFYTEGCCAAYPYDNFVGPLFVAANMEQYLNGTQTESQQYQYSNAVVHKQGRGFCGFKNVIMIDNIRNRSSTRVYDPYNFGVLKNEILLGVKNAYSYSFNVAANKIAKVRLTTLSTQDLTRGITINSSYTYDTYGSPLTEIIDYGDGITETVTNGYYNNTNENGYLLGFQINWKKTVNRNGATWFDSYVIPGYDNRGLPGAIVYSTSGGTKKQETCLYDSKGNLTEKRVKLYSSSNTLTTTYAYDSYGRLITETDPLGFSSTYEYNASNGSLYREKNHKGQYKTYSYDAFFRMNGYTYPEWTQGTTEYSWNAAGTNGLYCVRKWESGKPWAKTYYDALGRETASSGLNFDYSEPRTEKQYDNYGRLWKVSLPVISGSANLWNTYEYDAFDRPKSITEASGRITIYSYSGNSVKTTSDGIASKQTFDNQGNLTSVVDTAGTITYNLRPDGQPSSIVAPGSVTTSFTYDNYGRRLSIIDPSAGTQSCTYDADGNIATETNANGKTTSYKYDAYSRMIKKIRPEFTTDYVYNADGLLASETSSNENSTTYQYDGYGRLYKEKESQELGFYWLEKTYAYADSYLQSTQYASKNGSIVTENYYYDAGHLREIKLNETTSIWKLTSANAFGQTTGVTTGSFNRTYSYTAYGLPSGRTAGSFQDFSYNFDATKGNLSNRKDNKRNIQESFTYDELNRLKTYAGKTTDYDIKGNITSKTDVGSFQYNTSGKPYAISGVTSPSNLIPQRNQTITYTSFMRPASITEGDYTATFLYNSDDERAQMMLRKNGAKEFYRYYFLDCYEMDDRAVGGIKEKLYLGGDFYTAPAVYVKEGTGSWNIYYICRDYLGSITHITNSSGSVVQELSYDAWGQLRNPTNQTVYAPDAAPELFLGRGYTGHEHLPMFGLVNMNARLYDAALGRFLSPDPYVQSPLFSQNFNRYSYAMNNPLCYIDRDGKLVWFIPVIIAAVIGSYVGGSMANHSYNPLNWDFSSGKTWSNMGLGALIGGAGGAAAFFGGAAIGGAMCGALGIGTGGTMGGAVLGFAAEWLVDLLVASDLQP